MNTTTGKDAGTGGMADDPKKIMEEKLAEADVYAKHRNIVLERLNQFGGPVHPVEIDCGASGVVTHRGMFLRDWFAGQTLMGYMRLAYSPDDGYLPSATHADRVAECAYQIADAMLAERKKPTPTPDET